MRVKYILVPEIMTDDWVYKGPTKLNMFSDFGEQIKSLSSKQSTLNFWNRLNPKFSFLCRLLTQTATGRPNHLILTLSVTAILKALTKTFFLGPTLRVVRIFSFGERFFQQERVLLGWTFSYLIICSYNFWIRFSFLLQFAVTAVTVVDCGLTQLHISKSGWWRQKSQINEV